jgi:hypothetical protein
MEEIWNAYILLVGKPLVKCTLGRLKKSWEET